MSTDTIKRRETIIDMLYHDGSVKVTTLSQRFNVSLVTIRNDLRYLEKKAVPYARMVVQWQIINLLLTDLFK